MDSKGHGPPAYNAANTTMPQYGPPPGMGVTMLQPGVAVMPTIIAGPNVGPQPTTMTCPSCRTQIVTRVDYMPSTRTHIAAGVLCAFGCCLGCCLIPYCMNSCKNAEHYCPHCSAYIGAYYQR